MKKYASVVALFFILFITYLVYNNHFKNDFHFDDSHTIVENLYIRDLKSIPLFFKDGTTFSTLPQNQSYRPGVTTLNAIDFYLAGNPTPEPFMFHVSIFISYLMLGVFLYLFFLFLLTISLENQLNKYISLFTTAWFLWHTANAETINYIIARTDSFSTLLIVLSFVLYLYFPNLQKYYLYFIPVFLGFFVKETTFMVIPILVVYKLLFEQNLSVKQWFSTKLFTVLRQVAIPFSLSIILFLMAYNMKSTLWNPGGTSVMKYLFTQPFVIFHYTYNFILPLNLVVDSDWQAITSFTDDKVLAGIIFLIALLSIVYKTSFDKKNRPIAFGILWFFIALIPTSTIIPFAEVLNDHRTFFPYIGFFVASAAFFRNLIVKYALLENAATKWAIITTGIIFLSLHAYGTRQRNKIWATDESLWHECTIKAPKNGRGWMNYGLSLMKKGDYANAISCYEKTMNLWQNYAYVYINMGIAKAAIGDKFAAEENFKKALTLNENIPNAYLFYGNFLLNEKRKEEAKVMVEKGLKLSPKNEALQQLSETINNYDKSAGEKVAIASTNAQKTPTPENYLELSLQYYTVGDFRKCIEAANEALKLRPTYDLAYNNICAAYNRLGEFEKAIEVGEKGLKINPNNQLLRGNVAESYRLKKK